MSISLLPTSQRPSPQGVSRSNSVKTASSVHFGRVRDTYATDNRISDIVYQLLLKAPKNELHVHQGGSSSVEFLSYCLRKALTKNNAKLMADEKSRLDSLPLYKPDGTMEMVPFRTAAGLPLKPDELRKAMDKVLTRDNLRTYYRYQRELDTHLRFIDNEQIDETTAQHRPRHELISSTESKQLKQQRQRGLDAYRNTSAKINLWVKNNPAAYLLANDYAKNLAMENVWYTEYRVSPTGNGIGGANGSNIEDVLSAVSQGFRDAKSQLNQRTYPFDYGLLILFERQNRGSQEPPDAKIKRAVQLAKDVVRLKQEGQYHIAGVDLAGDEANNPVTEFKEVFDIIKAYNKTAPPKERLGITIHAGETTHSKDLQGYESIAESLRIAQGDNTAVRIGHGLQIINSSPALRKAFEVYRQYPNDWEKHMDKKALIEASPLLKQIIDHKIVLEMCPKSNLQTYGIHPGFPDEQFEVNRDEYSAKAYSRHPAVFLSRLGVKIAISSDNRTISNTDVTNEFVKLFKYGGLTYQDFKKMVLNGFEGAFIADPHKKATLMQNVRSRFAEMEKDPNFLKAIVEMDGGKLSLRYRWLMFKENLSSKLSAYWHQIKQAFTQLWQQLFQPNGKVVP